VPLLPISMTPASPLNLMHRSNEDRSINILISVTGDVSIEFNTVPLGVKVMFWEVKEAEILEFPRFRMSNDNVGLGEQAVGKTVAISALLT